MMVIVVKMNQIVMMVVYMNCIQGNKEKVVVLNIKKSSLTAHSVPNKYVMNDSAASNLKRIKAEREIRENEKKTLKLR